MTRRVVLLTADPETRRRVEGALAGRRVDVVDPDDPEDEDHGVVGDVAVLDADAGAELPPEIDPCHVVRLTDDRAAPAARSAPAGRSDGREPAALRVERPVDPDALREAVDRAFRRLTYVEGLDAFTAAATGHRRGAPDAGQASLRESLTELVEGFDHADFTAAFRDAVAGH